MVVESSMPQKSPNGFNWGGRWKLLNGVDFHFINLNCVLRYLVPYHNSFMNNKLALVTIQHQGGFLTSFQHLCQNFASNNQKNLQRQKKKSSIKNSMISSMRSWKIVGMHLWKVAGALHNPNNIPRYAKVPKGQIKFILSWSFKAMGIWKISW